MYAIVDILGKQFKVSPNQYIYAPKMEKKEGELVEFDRTLLLSRDDKTVEVGTPVLPGTKVSCKILEHVKGDKITVFKKKRRKGYTVKNGHRQQYTKIRIEGISG